MRDISFGQYYPADSAVHRMDPRTKLLFVFFYIIAIFFLRTLYGYLVAALYLTVVIAFSRVPFKTVLRSVRAVIFILVMTMALNVLFYSDGNTLWSYWKFTVTDAGLLFSGKMALRLILLVTGTSMLSYTTTPTALTGAIEWVLKPLSLLRINVHDIAVIMSIALRFIPTIQEETEKIISAQKARGASFDTGNIFKRARAMLPVLIPLFIGTFRRADELALALEARCYNLSSKRTRMKELRFSRVDIPAVLFVLIFVGVITAERLLSAYLI